MNVVFKVNTGFGVMQNLLTKTSMNAIPRVGEFVIQKGQSYIVCSVIHNLEFNNCEIILKAHYAYTQYKKDEK